MRTLCLLLALLFPVAAAGQTALPGRVEVAVGGRWVGSIDAGGNNAELTAPDDGRFALFTTESDVGATAAIEARLGGRLTQTLHVEGTVSYGRVDLRTRVASDVEGIPDVTVSERLDQIGVEVAFVEYLPGIAFGPRAIPFVSLGAGFARQLHEARALGETAGLALVGGGIALLTLAREQAPLNALGLRVDARVLFRKGGVAFDDNVRISPAFGASLFFRF